MCTQPTWTVLSRRQRSEIAVFGDGDDLWGQQIVRSRGWDHIRQINAAGTRAQRKLSATRVIYRLTELPRNAMGKFGDELRDISR